MANLNWLHSVISLKTKEVFILIKDLTQHGKEYSSEHVSAVHSGLSGKHIVSIKDSIIDNGNVFPFLWNQNYKFLHISIKIVCISTFYDPQFQGRIYSCITNTLILHNNPAANRLLHS
jgi:hypothetical protein